MQLKRKYRGAMTGTLLAAPLVIGCGVFLIAPFFELLRRSVIAGAGAGAEFVGLQNFRDLLKNSSFRQAVGNTLAFLSLSLPLIFVAAFALALVLQKKRRKVVLQTSILLPYVMPVVGTVTVLELLFGNSAGLTHEATLPMVVSLYLWKNLGYTALILATGLAIIPREHYESAQIDGANMWQQLQFVTIPQMRWCVFFSIVFSMINAFKCFREIFLIGGKHPPKGLYMLQHFLNNCFNNLNFTKLSCCAVVLLVVLAVPFRLAYLWIARKED